MSGIYPEIQATSVARVMIEAAQRDKIMDLTPMKLLKLVYIAHGWHLGLLNEPLLKQNAQAWQYGPVVPSVYHEFKSHGRNAIPFTVARSLPEASPIDRQRLILEYVWQGYRNFTGGQLSEMTHREGTPWWKTWHEFGGRERKGVPIDNMLIRDHYKGLLQGLQNESA